MHAHLAEGSLFANKFRVMGLLGEGGMGTVYLAEQLSTGKRRALKLMRVAAGLSPLAAERFTREARVGSLVESDHIVEVVDAGVDPATGIPWLAMEYLEGATLADRIGVGPMDLDSAQQMMRQLSHGLASAHRAGLIHRDLKPENIFLAIPRREGISFTVKILDFGIAKLVEDASHDSGASAQFAGEATGTAGTPFWMAPEQFEGGIVTPASDVWALGLIAFHALTGQQYWRSAYERPLSLVRLLQEMMAEAVVPASARAGELGCGASLPPGFDDWFARCVSYDPAKRFRHGGIAIKAFLELEGAAPGLLATARGFATLSAADAAGLANTMAVTSPTAPSSGASAQPLELANTLAATVPRGGPSAATSPGASASGSVSAVPAATEARSSPSVAFAFVGGTGALALLGAIVVGAVLALRPSAEPHEPEAPDVPTRRSFLGDTELEQLCVGGDAQSCARAGIPFTMGDGVEIDYRRAAAAYERACAGGAGLGCTNLGYAFQEALGFPEHIDKATRYYQLGCDLGDPAGCDLLGVLYQRGEGVPHDPARAVALFRQACDSGGQEGCDHVGRLYEAGTLVERDLDVALRSYQLGCELGQPDSCTSVGRLLAHGSPPDLEAARSFRERACVAAHPDPRGCADLGYMLLEGVGGPADVERARELLDRACVQSVAQACHNLAGMDRDGIAGRVDPVGAASRYARACTLGYQDACDAVERIRAERTGLIED